MTFTVTYRGAKGAPVTEAVEAADRADCLAQLKKRGIAPTSVKEGSAKQDKKAVGDRAKPTGRNGVAYVLLAACIILAVLGGIWLFGQGKEPPPQDGEVVRKHSALAKEVTPAKAAKPQAEPEPEPAAANTPVTPRSESLRDPSLSSEKQEELYVKKLEETPIPEASTNRLFRTALEQVMGWVFSTKLGDMPPPLPPLPDYDLVHLEEILNLRNTVNDTDTDRQANEKEIVDYVKEELKKFIAKGGAPEDFLKYYHDELKSAYAERSMAQERVINIMQEDPAAAMEYMKEANKALAAKGIKGVVLPERTLMRMGIDPKLLKGDNYEYKSTRK